MNAKSLKAATSSADQTWRTPKHVLELVRQISPIALDPATDPTNPTEARFAAIGLRHPNGDSILDGCSILAVDGLSIPWRAASGLVYCNPPYGRTILRWAEKFSAEGLAGCELVTLTPARPDTKWFQQYMTTATTRCFWKGRLTFVGGKFPALFPIVLSYWGPRADKFRKVFEPFGWIVG